jgi:hypothetical protein
MSFQTAINVTQAPAVAGDFASANPRHSTLSTPGGFVANGTNGLTVGLFAWADSSTGTILSNTGSGAPTCFVHRCEQAVITTYLGNASMTIPAGMGVGEMFDGGDFWVKNAGAGSTTIGMKAFANTTNGTISFAATGATVAGSVETKWYCASIAATGELVKMTSQAPG